MLRSTIADVRFITVDCTTINRGIYRNSVARDMYKYPKNNVSSMWKCPKCSFRSRSYQAVQKHYFSKHHKSKSKKAINKGKESKVHVFRPKVGK